MEPTNPTSPINPSPALNPAPAKKSTLPIILGIFILLIIVGSGAYYLGTQNIKNTLQNNTQQIVIVPTSTIQPTMVENPTISPTQSAIAVPTDWTLKNSNTCNVTIQLPPKKAPYFIPEDLANQNAVGDAGGYWHYEEGTAGFEKDNFFSNESLAIFKNPNAMGSGYVSGIVQVICGPNNQNYSTESFIDAYAKQFTDGTSSGLDFKQDGKLTLWGHEVIQATITGGMFSEDDKEYYFATSSKLYRIRTLSMSSNQTIKSTTQQIFNNLQFSN